jgi:hypothetical protein
MRYISTPGAAGPRGAAQVQLPSNRLISTELEMAAQGTGGRTNGLTPRSNINFPRSNKKTRRSDPLVLNLGRLLGTPADLDKPRRSDPIFDAIDLGQVVECTFT